MSKISHAPYGTLPDGTTVEQFVLANARGTSVSILTYGGIVTALETADRAGRRANIVLGCADLAGYCADTSHFGAIVGRYANRIARGRFSLDGATIQLACNDPPNSLHGGDAGFGKVAWQAVAADTPNGAWLALRHVSAHGAGGYPGITSGRFLGNFATVSGARLNVAATICGGECANQSENETSS